MSSRADRTSGSVAPQLEEAFARQDLELLGSLLTDDVRWGDDDHPRRCRSRSDVVATFSRVLVQGVTGELVAMEEAPDALICELRVTWPEGERRSERRLFHLYRLRDGKIAEIQPFDDRRSARAAARGK